MTLLDEIDRYLSRSGMAPTTFGLRAVKDGKFVGRLRERPNGVTLTTVERVRQWIRDNPPKRKRSAA